MFILPKTTIVDFSGRYTVDRPFQDPRYNIEHVDCKCINEPVNIRLVETFKKDELSINDSAELTAYLIKFKLQFREKYILWYFKDEEEREFEFEKILKLED